MLAGLMCRNQFGKKLAIQKSTHLPLSSAEPE